MTGVLIPLALLCAFGAGWVCTRRHTTATLSIKRDESLTPQSLAKTKLIITTFCVSDGGLAALGELVTFVLLGPFEIYSHKSSPGRHKHGSLLVLMCFYAFLLELSQRN